jgi:hypothetical protein
MKTYFVLSFVLFAVLCFALAANWWILLPFDMPFRLILPGFGVALGILSLVSAIGAAFTRYRR